MPMSDMLAMRLGRPDLTSFSSGGFPDPNQPLNSMMDVTSSASNSGLTLGRMGLTIILIMVGGIAISYISTRARQY